LESFYTNLGEENTWEKIFLGAQIGRGATGNVYLSRFGSTDFAAKIYHDRSKFDSEKIGAMLENPPKNLYRRLGGINYPQFAWPLAIIKDAVGYDSGILLPLIDLEQSFSLDHYYDSILFKKLNSADEEALSYRIEIAQNLAEIVADLHDQEHFFIDCKPQNIRVFKNNHIVTLLDCDGFSIKGQRKRFAAELVSTDYIAPEAVRRNLSPQKLREPQDRYALAVILFQLLNRGTHPFQGIPVDKTVTEGTNDDKAAAGLYPHGLGSHEKVKPRPQSLHHLWDIGTRLLFDQAFTTESPTKRPTARDWATHFKGILANKELARCEKFPNDLRHIRFNNLGCAACYLAGLKPTAPKPSKVASVRPEAAASNAASPNQPPQGYLGQKQESNWGWWAIAAVVGFGLLHLYRSPDKRESQDQPAVVVAPSEPTTPATSSTEQSKGVNQVSKSESPSSQQQAKDFASLYVSENRAIGYAVGYSSAREAESNALYRCNFQRIGEGDQCIKVLSGVGACISISRSENGAIGAAIGNSRTEAQKTARESCRTNGGTSCTVLDTETFCRPS